MSVTLRPDPQLPEIRERCPVCNRYEQHANGSLQVPAPMDISADRVRNVSNTPSISVVWRSATQCLRCAWVTVYH